MRKKRERERERDKKKETKNSYRLDTLGMQNKNKTSN